MSDLNIAIEPLDDGLLDPAGFSDEDLKDLKPLRYDLQELEGDGIYSADPSHLTPMLGKVYLQ